MITLPSYHGHWWLFFHVTKSVDSPQPVSRKEAGKPERLFEKVLPLSLSRSKPTIDRTFIVEFSLSPVKRWNDCTFQVNVQFRSQKYWSFGWSYLSFSRTKRETAPSGCARPANQQLLCQRNSISAQVSASGNISKAGISWLTTFNDNGKINFIPVLHPPVQNVFPGRVLLVKRHIQVVMEFIILPEDKFLQLRMFFYELFQACTHGFSAYASCLLLSIVTVQERRYNLDSHGFNLPPTNAYSIH